MEFLGHDFQGPADVGHHLLAVFPGVPGGAARGLHQLQIVDDNHAQVLDPPALGVHVGHGQGGVVVNVDFGVGQGRGGHFIPIVRGELAGHELFVVQEGLAGDQTGGQLLPAHFQGKKDHALAGELSRV